MGFRRSLAVITARSVNFISRMMGKQGVTMAGKYALKVYPNLLKDLSSQVREKIIVTCGTNGKTTTNNMMAAFIKSEGKKVIINSTGSNMLAGVVSAFVLSASLGGKIDCDYACIEVDEASARRVFPHFKPDYMVLTNLFRDQLDRYGEIDITMNLLSEALDMAPDCKLIINADDVLAASFAKKSGHEFVGFGIDKPCSQFRSSENEIREGRFCLFCGSELKYDFYHFSQLGSYACPNCGFKHPLLKYNATDVSLSKGLKFAVEEKSDSGDTKKRALSSNYRGFYNIYNILASYACGRELKFDLNKIDKILNNFKPENGRMESFKVRDCNILLNLAKNPAGFNQNISSVMEDESEKDLIVVINDNAQDGHDISWLWDVDFERFADANVRNIVVSGLRAYDMQLRFKYSEIESEAVMGVEDAINHMLKKGSKNLYILVNYTALFSTRGLLKGMEKR